MYMLYMVQTCSIYVQLTLLFQGSSIICQGHSLLHHLESQQAMQATLAAIWCTIKVTRELGLYHMTNGIQHHCENIYVNFLSINTHYYTICRVSKLCRQLWFPIWCTVKVTRESGLYHMTKGIQHTVRNMYGTFKIIHY